MTARSVVPFLAALLSLGLPAQAQQVPPPPSSPGTAACAPLVDVPPQRLYGLWQLALWPEEGSEDRPVSRGAMLFEPHPEYAGGVRGHLKRSGPGNDLSALVSGDVEDGEFALDESADGRRIDAAWIGALPPAACGREIRGQRHPANQPTGENPAPVLNFVLRRASEKPR